MTITTFTSLEINQDIARAKKMANLGPVFITNRGKPAHVLLCIEDYRRLTGKSRTLVDSLAMPGLADVDLNPWKSPSESGLETDAQGGNCRRTPAFAHRVCPAR